MVRPGIHSALATPRLLPRCPRPGSKACWEGARGPQGLSPEQAFLSEGADPRP